MASTKDTETVAREQAEFEAGKVNGNGKSLEDMARDGDADPEDDGTPQLVLPGTGSKLSGNAGGKKPTESLFKMRGVSLPIAGGVQMDKDTEMWVAVPVAIDDVHVGNRRKNREIVGVVRTHTAIPLGQPIIMEGPPPGYND